MNMHRTILVLLLSLAVTNICAADPDPVRMATTTSTRSSGLLDVLVPAFEQASGYRMELAVVGTGRALHLGRRGDVDVILVHAPAAEREFVEKGWGVDRRSVMKNDFIIVGPSGDPAGIRGSQDAGIALKMIAETQSVFVSRGDDSGTHKKEQQCWSAAAIEPSGTWYYEAGMSMGDTLKLASEKQYYTLVDRGTWLNARKNIELQLLVKDDAMLENQYSVISVNPELHPGVNQKGAEEFSNWLLSSDGQRLIAGHKIDGEQLFFVTSGEIN